MCDIPRDRHKGIIFVELLEFVSRRLYIVGIRHLEHTYGVCNDVLFLFVERVCHRKFSLGTLVLETILRPAAEEPVRIESTCGHGSHTYAEALDPAMADA